MSGETKAQVSGWTIDTVYMHLGSRIDELDRLTTQRFEDLLKSREAKFAHVEQLFTMAQENAKRAVDKAEAAQNAHNVAANEWRGTLNDFKATLISRSEFDRLYADFSAFKLEAARLAAAQSGQRETQREHKDDSKALIAMVLSVIGVIVAVVSVVFRYSA